MIRIEGGHPVYYREMHLCPHCGRIVPVDVGPYYAYYGDFTGGDEVICIHCHRTLCVR